MELVPKLKCDCQTESTNGMSLRWGYIFGRKCSGNLFEAVIIYYCNTEITHFILSYPVYK